MVMSEAPAVLEALDEIETVAAELCGQRNAITAQLVDLLVRLDADALWESTGARSPAPSLDEEPPDPPAEPAVDRTVSTWSDDFGAWHARVQLPIEEGAYAEQALQAHKDALVQEWKRARKAAEEAGIEELSPPPFPTTADAFLRLCERGLDVAARERPHSDRTTVVLHLDVESRLGELHLGPALTEAERRYLCCDATFETWFERDGEVIGAARASRKIPRRLRRALERRDRCCQVPGCSATAGLHAHHIVHWEDGGPTELWNLTSHTSILTLANPIA